MTTNTRHERAGAPRHNTRHWKRILSGALVLLLMTAFLAACGTTDQEEPAGTELPGAGVATEIAEPEATATEEPVPVTGDEEETDAVTDTTEAGEAVTDTTEAGDDDAEAITGTTEAETEAGAAVDLGDITANPEEYYGQTVTAEADVNVVLGPNAFTIADPELIDLGEILVINADGGATVTEEDSVRVTGTVRQFVEVEVEDEFGLDLDDELVAEFEAQPAIVASSVEVVEETGADAGAGEAGETVTDTTGAATEEPSEALTDTGEADADDGETLTDTTDTGATAPGGALTLSDLTDNPEAYTGQTVTVEGQVNVVLNPNAFTIADVELVDLSEVLVINTNQTAATPAITEDQSVRVTGTVQQFNQADVESQLGGIDLPDALLSGFEGRVVILAESIEVIDTNE